MFAQYHESLQQILDEGIRREDRTGVGTLSVFGQQHRYDLSKGFPAVTTKKLAWKSVVSELLWMLEGSGDERRLAEIHFDKPRDELTDKKTIWTANANSEYWRNSPYGKDKFEGYMGRVYGVQWRHHRTWDEQTEQWEEVDQIKTLVEGLINAPHSRRHIVDAWNPSELDQMALPPCHMFFQCYVDNEDRLSLQLYQRSADMALGVPFNIAFYSCLTHMLAKECGYQVGNFVHTFGDAHIYLNHIDAVQEQLRRYNDEKQYALPTIWLNPEVKSIYDYTRDDIKLLDYQSHPTIKMDMAV